MTGATAVLTATGNISLFAAVGMQGFSLIAVALHMSRPMSSWGPSCRVSAQIRLIGHSWRFLEVGRASALHESEMSEDWHLQRPITLL